MIKEVIILAGGLGTRLASTIIEIPKCLAPVSGKPFLHYVITHLKKQGIEKFIFALSYKSQDIINYIRSEHPELKVEFSMEEEPLGTGGAIKKACVLLQDKTVLVVNGDTLFSININKLNLFHDMCGADCTLSLVSMHHFERFGTVELNKDYSIKSFKEKQRCEAGLINGGVYALHAKRFLEEDLHRKFSFEKEYLEKHYNKRRMFGVIQNEYFIDIGTPEDYAKAQKELTQPR